MDEADRIYVAPDDVIANKYRVERVLGAGGVGFVVAAKHVELGGYFALKFLRRRFLHDPAIVERFTREAKAACWIQHEYSARVYDVGLHDGAPFIVMEYLVGRDLAAVLAERGALGIAEATEHTLQACAALAVAHANGVVHRDIKPENLFLVDQNGPPTIKLLDFGISKFALTSAPAAGEWAMEGEPITGTMTCGTPLYMSPEQIRSTATVDARSDVWSLGMVLYELLASAPAFQFENVTDVCAAILEQEPRRLSDVRPEVPARLADVVARCLQKDPADRFQNVAELAIALLPFAPPRALAIAEGSAWIRSAAIHSLGQAGAEPRISGGYSIASSPSSTLPTVSKRPPPAANATLPARKWLPVAAVAVLLVAVGTFASYRRLHESVGTPVPANTLATAAEEHAPAPAPAPPPMAPAAIAIEARSVTPAPPLGPGPATVGTESASSSVRVPPGARPHAPSKMFRAPSPKAASAATASAESTAIAPKVAPPVATRSPQLGD